MKKFFYSDGHSKHGPFDMAELKVENISPETLIWYEGLDDWKSAKDIEEMIPILELITPPLPMGSDEELINTNQEKDIKNKDLNESIKNEENRLPSLELSALGTKWLSFLNYFNLPLIVLGLLIANINAGHINFLSITIYFIVIPLIYGLHKRKLYAYSLFILNSFFYPILYAFAQSNLSLSADFVAQAIVFVILWTTPNILYIRKREGLFIN
jgi:hypothetical protein